MDIHTDSPAERFAVGSVLATDPAAAGPLTVSELRPHQGRLLITLRWLSPTGTSPTSCAGCCCWWTARASPTRRTRTSSTTTSWSACGPRHAEGDGLGEVVRIDHAPASDLLVLRLPDGRTGLVPFVRAIVPEVDVAGGRVVVTPPEGLFDL